MSVKTAKYIEDKNGDLYLLIPPCATENEYGGIKAKTKDDTNEHLAEVVVGENGKAYADVTEQNEEIVKMNSFADGTATKTLQDGLTSANTNITVLQTNKADKSALAKTDKKLDALWKINEGQTYDFDTDDDDGYVKDVPSGALMADVKSFGGKSVVWNQLWGSVVYETEIAGIVKTPKTGYIETWSGTTTGNDTSIGRVKSFTPIINHIYCTMVSGTAVSKFNRIQSAYGSIRPNSGETSVGCCMVHKYTTERTSWYLQAYYDEGTVFENDTVTAFIVDMTKMFGITETSQATEEMKSMIEAYAEAHPEHNEGEIVSADVDKVVVKGKNIINLPSVDFENRVALEDGSISSYSYENGIVNLNYISCNPSTTYSISYDVSVGSVTVYEYDSNYSYIKRTPKYNATSYTFTTSEQTQYIRFFFYKSGGVSISDFSFIQLEKGSSATAYSQYHTESYPIPSSIKSLTGYGWSAGDVCNEVDFERKKFVQRVGKLTFDSSYTLTPNDESLTAETLYYVRKNNVVFSLNDAKKIAKGFTEDFHSVNINYPNNMLEMSITRESDKYIFVRIETLTKEAATEKYIKGKTLYYELAEPIETDISDILDSFEVKAGGTITFHQTSTKLSVPNKIEYLRKLLEVVTE